MTQAEIINRKFVITIVNHPLFNWILEPFAVQLLNDGSFALNANRLNLQNAVSYVDNLSDVEWSILKHFEDCRENALAKYFTFNRETAVKFMAGLKNNPALLKRVLARLRKKNDHIIQLLVENNIPVYFKGNNHDFIKEKPIYPEVSFLDVLFCFEIKDEKLHYYIEPKLNNTELKLNEGNTLILNYEPCWLISNNKFIRVNDNVDGKKIQPFLTKINVVVEPHQVENYLKKFVTQIVSTYKFKLINIPHAIFNEKPKSVLSIETTFYKETALVLRFEYKNIKFEYGSNEHSDVSVENDTNGHVINIIKRDIAEEERIKTFLEENGFVYLQDALFYPVKVQINEESLSSIEIRYQIINCINENHDLLNKNGIEFKNLLPRPFFTGKIELFQQFKEDSDWFDVHIYVIFGDFRLPFMTLKNNIINNNRELVLPDGTVAILPEEWFAKYFDLATVAQSDNEHIKLKKSQVAYISNIIEKDNKLYDFIESTGIGTFPTLPEPQGLLKKLRPYQLRGMSWFCFLKQHNFGGCLSDDMGLGKTIQVLAFLLKMKQETPLSKGPVQLNLFDSAQNYTIGQPSLIVLPLSLIHNWQYEIKNTAPTLRWFVYFGINREFNKNTFKQYDIIFTTYGTVRNDIERLKDFEFRFIFLDESQNIKNPGSKLFSAVSQLKAGLRFALTGTPIENSLIDLWSQMNFVNPDMLGDLKHFKERFYLPIEKAKSKESEQKFRQLINPFILRRTKNEVAKDLPELTEKIHFCTMSDEQAQLYEKRKSEIRNYIIESKTKVSKEKSYMLILSGLMRLRLLANHPIITESDYTGDSGKFNEITENIQKITQSGHKVLIFSQFVKHLQLYTQYLEEQSIPHLLLTGKTPSAQRQTLVNLFQQSNEFPVFLISLRAGGVGLNLTSADYVFLLDPWWNPAVEKQAINRAHRIGQEKHVFSYKFICENTIEEKIIALQQRKQDLFDNFINYKSLQKLSLDEIEMLME